MEPRTITPQFSQWMQDFFGEGIIPNVSSPMSSLYQGMPLGSEELLEGYQEDTGLTYEGGVPIYWTNEFGDSFPVPATGEPFFYNPTPEQFYEAWGIGEELRPSDEFISDYPTFKEEYELLDYTLGGERIRHEAESERFKLEDILGDIQETGPKGLRVGGVSRELENKRDIINQGLLDLEARKAFGLKAQEIDTTAKLYDLRKDYEEQVSSDWLRWLSNEPVIPEGIDWSTYDFSGYDLSGGTPASQNDLMDTLPTGETVRCVAPIWAESEESLECCKDGVWTCSYIG
jgi:hypothetical protein